MYLARNISLFVNFDQSHERKNLKDCENSVIFDVFFRIFAISHVIKVEIGKSEMLQVKDIILLHFAKNRSVISQKPSPVSRPPYFPFLKQKLP